MVLLVSSRLLFCRSLHCHHALPSSFTISPRGSPMPKISAPQAFSSTHIIQLVENRNERTRDFLKVKADPDSTYNCHGSSIVPNSESSPCHPHIRASTSLPSLYTESSPQNQQASDHLRTHSPTPMRLLSSTLMIPPRPTNTRRHLPTRYLTIRNRRKHSSSIAPTHQPRHSHRSRHR
jgi:hypothetical protein